MNKISAVALISLTLGIASTAMAEGSAQAGKAKSAVCAACHGVDGNSVNPEWPSLAGQHADYIVDQIAAYKFGARQNALMSPQAALLSDRGHSRPGGVFLQPDADTERRPTRSWSAAASASTGAATQSAASPPASPVTAPPAAVIRWPVIRQ